MKNILVLVFSVFTCTLITAQTTVEIIANDTKKPIDFATILLPDYKKSFVANEKGIFTVDTNKYKLPLNVIIQNFGFEKKEIILQNSTAVNVFLNPVSELLKEIIIPPANAKIKDRTIGRTNESSGLFSGEDSTYKPYKKNSNTGYEFGMQMNTKKKFLKVKKIHWHLQGFNFKRGYFSIYFYEIVNGKPSTKIPHKKNKFHII